MAFDPPPLMLPPTVAPSLPPSQLALHRIPIPNTHTHFYKIDLNTLEENRNYLFIEKGDRTETILKTYRYVYGILGPILPSLHMNIEVATLPSIQDGQRTLRILQYSFPSEERQQFISLNSIFDVRVEAFLFHRIPLAEEDYFLFERHPNILWLTLPEALDVENIDERQNELTYHATHQNRSIRDEADDPDEP